MKKPLEQMSNEELWQLFPILLSPHDPAWKAQYEEERHRICEALGRENIYRIHHFGSTSVPGLTAKPTVDILLEVFPAMSDQEILAAIKGIGYLYSPQPDNPAPHMMFMKGYTQQGFAEKVYHLHLRYPGDWKELYFRDYLIEHPDIAEQYGALKERLSGAYRHDRDGYTREKTRFIDDVTRRATERYRGRYTPPQG